MSHIKEWVHTGSILQKVHNGSILQRVHTPKGPYSKRFSGHMKLHYSLVRPSILDQHLSLAVNGDRYCIFLIMNIVDGCCLDVCSGVINFPCIVLSMDRISISIETATTCI